MQMKSMRLLIALVVLLFTTILHAQDISGSWQGTLKTGKDLRCILQVEKDGKGGWKAKFYSIDQSTDSMPASSFSFQDATIKFAIDQVRGSYEGKLSRDGNTIIGTWTQGKPLPLELQRATKETAWQIDPTPHAIQFITVEKDIKLEVIDWGGTGRPLVLLTGLGNNAHVFDKFALKLTPTYHVYGITRRGFGTSSAPSPETASYAADRLGDDVLFVIDTLKLDRPIIAGHSIAGEELTSVATRHPEKVSGLIYLDAGYPYALYDKAHGNMLLDSIELRRKLEQLLPGKGPLDQKTLVDDLLTETQRFEKELQQRQEDMRFMPPPPSGASPTPPPAAPAIIAGQQKYTEIKVPVLAIFAVPHNLGSPPIFRDHPEARAAAEAADLRDTENQAKAFETQVPNARVVRLPHANHYVFQSNEADVLRDMNAFITGLQAEGKNTSATHTPGAQQ
jgi:pimeloyl-ACP methyl ester carboxylesterase